MHFSGILMGFPGHPVAAVQAKAGTRESRLDESFPTASLGPSSYGPSSYGPQSRGLEEHARVARLPVDVRVPKKKSSLGDERRC